MRCCASSPRLNNHSNKRSRHRDWRKLGSIPKVAASGQSEHGFVQTMNRSPKDKQVTNGGDSRQPGGCGTSGWAPEMRACQNRYRLVGSENLPAGHRITPPLLCRSSWLTPHPRSRPSGSNCKVPEQRAPDGGGCLRPTRLIGTAGRFTQTASKNA